MGKNEYRAMGTTAGAYDDWHEGNDPPPASTTQNPALAYPALWPVAAGAEARTITSASMTLESCRPTRARCGKSHVLNLEPEDLVALTVESAAMAGVPLAGTTWIPGQS